MLRRILGIEVEEHAGGNARRTRTARIQRVGWHRNRRRCCTWRMLAALPIDAIARSDLSPLRLPNPGEAHADRPRAS